jgi:hypothetical protein
MKFLFPQFLFALFALAAPIIIHLFSFRKFKRVYFTNVKFLRDLKEETSSRRNLRHLLVLLCRCLALAFLVFAFAQPFIPGNNAAQVASSKAISIYIDNSFTMSATGSEGELFETARRKATSIAGAYKASDKFQLLTNDYESRHQRLVNRDDFLKLVDEVKISPASRKMSEIISRQKQAVGKEEKSRKMLYLISDFQESMADVENLSKDTSVSIQMVPVKANEQKNLVIDSCWLTAPFVRLKNPNTLKVRIRNYSSEPMENGSVTLKIDGAQKALGSLNIPANGTAEPELTFSMDQTGWHEAELSILDDPIVFDDHMYFSFEVALNLPVLNISRGAPNPYVQSLFGNDDYFVLTNVNISQVDYSSFGKYRLIILNEPGEISSGMSQELRRYAEKGGNILLLPPSEENADAVSGLKASFTGLTGGTIGNVVGTPMEVSYINSKEPVFSGIFEKNVPDNIDLPQVKKYYTLSLPGRATEELMRLKDGNLFLGRIRSGSGNFFISAVPLNTNWSNAPRHAIFVSVLLNMAMQSNTYTPLYYTIGSSKLIALDAKMEARENVYKLKNDNYEAIPEVVTRDGKMNLYVSNELIKAGNYRLVPAGGSAVKLPDQPVISFNYDRMESVPRYLEPEKISGELEAAGIGVINAGSNTLAATISSIDNGTQLWKLCIILSLIFLGFEILLLKFLR